MSGLNSQVNRVVWVDIPVADLDRACAFYRAVLQIGVEKVDMGGLQIAVLHHQDGNGGCLIVNPADVSATGPLIYLNVTGRIQAAIAAVPGLGGSVVTPLHSLGPHGFRAIIHDSEGNRIALHSETDA